MLDGNTILDARLDAMLQMQRKDNAFEGWLAEEISTDVEVLKDKGQTDRTLGEYEFPTNARSSGVAKGAPASRYGEELGQMDYQVKRYHAERPIDDGDLQVLEAYQDGGALDEQSRKAAHQVYFDREREKLVPILDGTGTGNKAASSTKDLTGQEFNAAGSDTEKNIMDGVEMFGADSVAMARNVELALLRDSDITGSNAGSGQETVGRSFLQAWFEERGVSNYWVIYNRFQDQAPELGLSLSRLGADIFCLFTMGNIKRFTKRNKDLEYDAYFSHSTDEHVVGAKGRWDMGLAFPELCLPYINTMT